MRSGSFRYIPSVDGLRGVAVLLVFAAHAIPGFVAGRVGVDVFFVISGYLITSILLREIKERSEIDLRAFYMRRLIRLAPPLLALVLVHSALTPVWSAHGETPRQLVIAWAAALTYTWNILQLTVGVMPGVWLTLSHLWSLAQEEQFYMFFPLILLVVLRRGATPRALVYWLSVGATTTLALYMLTATSIFGEFSPLTRSFGLLAGCALAVALNFGLIRAIPASLAGVSVAALVSALWACTSGVIPMALDIPLGVVASTVVVGHLASTNRGALASVLSQRMMVWLGLVSYSFYLWHLPCIVVARDVFQLDPWSSGVTALVASLLFAWLTRKLIEVPAARFKERWVKSSGHEAGARSAASPQA